MNPTDKITLTYEQLEFLKKYIDKGVKKLNDDIADVSPASLLDAIDITEDYNEVFDSFSGHLPEECYIFPTMIHLINKEDPINVAIASQIIYAVLFIQGLEGNRYKDDAVKDFCNIFNKANQWYVYKPTTISTDLTPEEGNVHPYDGYVAIKLKKPLQNYIEAIATSNSKLPLYDIEIIHSGRVQFEDDEFPTELNTSCRNPILYHPYECVRGSFTLMD